MIISATSSNSLSMSIEKRKIKPTIVTSYKVSADRSLRHLGATKLWGHRKFLLGLFSFLGSFSFLNNLRNSFLLRYFLGSFWLSFDILFLFGWNWSLRTIRAIISSFIMCFDFIQTGIFIFQIEVYILIPRILHAIRVVGFFCIDRVMDYAAWCWWLYFICLI